MSSYGQFALWSCAALFLFQAPAATAATDADCLQCHSDKSLTKTSASGKEVFLYVDAAKLAASVHRTSQCAECHNDLKPEHPDDNVPARRVDCARCHTAAAAEYGAGSHGRAFAAGVRDAPGCVDCHGEHEMASLNHGASGKATTALCGRCHASERLNTRYNLPADRVTTFFDSYHGLASRFDATVAANCASCHGFHKILPSTDPGSTIHRNNLVVTCGKCHPGASEKFATGKIHTDIAATKSPPDWGGRINGWVRRVYLWLILGVVGVMFVHNALMFARKLRARLRSSNRPVVRMNRSQRWQHAVLAVSFIALAVTGFALKFPDSWLGMALGSSEPIRRWTHRIAGIVLLGVGLHHIIYLLVSKDGRRLVKDLFPIKRDLGDVGRAGLWLVGLSRTRPAFGRFGYAEKMEYWAVVWGTIIMGVTGLMVWFKLGVTAWLPRWAVEVALTIHYYEAILACLAIVVWHFYHVMFDPDVYPLNPACWDGKVSGHWQQEEHSLEQTATTKPPEADMQVPRSNRQEACSPVERGDSCSPAK